ncbi:MAG TPA: hypothetical protein VFU07_06885 [Candidatus Lumbricidophila sp.]|nr:hypothetical protein [Candidatus Lumbricidophila sp.]
MSMRSRATVGAIVGVPLFVLGILGAAASATATSPADGDHKVPYCHATHSEKNPYVYIETDKIAVVKAHSMHQDLEDVYPGFWFDDHGTITWFEGQGDPNFALNGCMAGTPTS